MDLSFVFFHMYRTVLNLSSFLENAFVFRKERSSAPCDGEGDVSTGLGAVPKDGSGANCCGPTAGCSEPAETS